MNTKLYRNVLTFVFFWNAKVASNLAAINSRDIYSVLTLQIKMNHIMLTVTLRTSYFSDVVCINVLQRTDNFGAPLLPCGQCSVLRAACCRLHCRNDTFVHAASPHQSSPTVLQSSPHMLHSTRHLCVACVVTQLCRRC